MAPKKDSAITISRILDCFKSTGKYPCPKDLLGFYKMASSENMMKFFRNKNAFKKSWDSNVDAIIPMKETKDAKGKVKKNKLSPKELEKKVDEFLKTELDITLFPIVFKRLISYYLKGTTILDEKQYKMLEDIYEKFTEPKDRMKKVNAIIDKLPQNSIIILGHLIYLGKLFLENFPISCRHDEAERRFFNVPALIIYNEMEDNDDKKKKKKKDDKPMTEIVQKMVHDFWREELDFTPKLCEYTISEVLQYLNDRKGYVNPLQLNHFYKIAVSPQMMEYITKVGFLYKEGETKKLKELFPKQSMKDENGDPVYSWRELIRISKKVLANDTDKENISEALFFGSAFKKIITQCYNGNSIINDIQYSQLEKLDQKFTDPDSKAKAMLEFLNKKLSDELTCLLAHLLYLGKIFIQTNEAFKNCDNHDSAVKTFFKMFGIHIYEMSIEEVKKRQKKNSVNKMTMPSSYPVLERLILYVWRNDIAFIPNLSAAARQKYNLKLTITSVIKNLKELGKYNYPSELEAFYTMATSDQMMEIIITKGAFIEQSKIKDLKKILIPKREQRNTKKEKVRKNKYSPEQLKQIVDQFEATQTESITLYIDVFINITMYYLDGVSVLNKDQYAELEKIYKKNKYQVTRMKAVLDFIDKMPEKSICIIVHLILLSQMFVSCNGYFINDRDRSNALACCVNSGPAILIYDKTFNDPDSKRNDSVAIEKLLLDCWRASIDYIPDLSDKLKMKYGIL